MVGNPRLRTLAKVLAIQHEQVEVEACSAGRCAQCPGGCNWGGFRGPRRLSLTIPQDLVLRPGDQVWIALSRAAMLRGAWWAYGLPLAGLLLAAGFGHLLGGDRPALIGGILGAGLGWELARRLSQRFWSVPKIEAIADRVSR